MKYLVKCSQCNKEIKRYYKYNNYFCSIKCQSEYRRAICTTKILAKCVVCDKEFKLKKSQYEERNKNKNITCSRKCMGELRKKIYLGKDNPNCRYPTLPNDFFEKIDTQQKAYILGFIASDGSLNKNGAVTISINNKDEKILKKIRDIVCGEIPISKKDKDMITLRFHSKIMTKDICRWLKIEPGKKDDKVKMPNLRNKLKWHFLRGFFDGDGTVRKKKKGRYLDCAIYTYSFSLRASIEKLCKNNIKCNNSNKWKYVGWCGDNARKFLDKLYCNSTIRMERKYETYLSWK